jgi:hypothetical protein
MSDQEQQQQQQEQREQELRERSAHPAAAAGAPLRFEVHRQLRHARAGTVHLPHGPVRTPVFMPGACVRACLLCCAVLCCAAWCCGVVWCMLCCGVVYVIL